MSELSLAAQAIREAVDVVFALSSAPPTTEEVAAAVLRAAAEQEDIKPEPVGPMPDASPEQVEIALAVKRSQVRAHRAILAIAAELEGHHG